MSANILQQAEALIQLEKYYPARKLLLKEVQLDPINTSFWRPLANTYLNQGYIREAFEIYNCLQLLYPKDTTYEKILKKIQPFVADAKPQGTFFSDTLKLKNTTVTVAMIFKDEIAIIAKWYEHIQGHVDQIIAVDTGSSDGTRQFLENKDDVQIIDFPWNDNFSEARNAATPYITSEWVLWIDSDEYYINPLETINSIKFIANFYETMGLIPILQVSIHNIIENSISKLHEVSRMYKPLHHTHQGRIHEQVVPFSKEILPIRFYTGITFLHSGYDTQTMIDKKKLDRNLRLLKLDAIDNPDSPFIYLLLGRESRLKGDHIKALEYLKIAEKNIENDPNFARSLDIYANLVLVQYELRLLEDAEESCYKGLALEPNFPNILYYLNAIRVQKAIDLLDLASQDFLKFEDAIFNYHGNVEIDSAIINGGNAILKAELLKNKGFLAEAENILLSLPKDQLTEEANNILTFVDTQRKKLQ